MDEVIALHLLIFVQYIHHLLPSLASSANSVEKPALVFKTHLSEQMTC